MIRALAGAAALALVATAAAGAAGGRILTRMTVSGEITALGPGRIAVGHLACRVPAVRVQAIARFVIGDPVRLQCRNGIISTVSYAPEVAPGQSYSTHPVTTPGTSTPAAAPPVASSPSAVAHASYFISSAFPPETSFTVATATGTVTAWSFAGVTVGDLTCTLPGPFAPNSPLYALGRVGDTASISCRTDTGRLVSMQGSRSS